MKRIISAITVIGLAVGVASTSFADITNNSNKAVPMTSTPILLGDRFKGTVPGTPGTPSLPSTITIDGRTYSALAAQVTWQTLELTVGSTTYDLLPNDGGSLDPWNGGTVPASFDITIDGVTYVATEDPK